ncbi:MAG: CD3072 family TudS-related putative desulfidase [Candidatus Thorarchaeota archaeon]|jgi:predicted secreted protein
MKRSRKVAVLAHCILNQNAKVEDIALYSAIIPEVVNLVVERGYGIIQMACPETIHLGLGRWECIKDQYETSSFKHLCKRLALEVLDQLEDYEKNGYTIGPFIGIDGSPSCGVSKSCRADKEGANPKWCGSVHSPPSWIITDESGVLFDIIKEEAKKRGKTYSYIGIPEVPEVGDFDSAMKQLDKLLE